MILASRDFPVVRTLCNRTIVMQHGHVVFDGKVDDAIDHYYKSMSVVVPV
jgi:ABC-type polysaccharide/polyol phosphate transport system ATPase subunit